MTGIALGAFGIDYIYKKLLTCEEEQRMDYTEALMNLIMVLGFVLVFSPKTSYIYANTTEKHQKFYRGIGIILAVWGVASHVLK